jgi:hypothetical protein
MKTAIASLAVTLVAVALVSSKPANADHVLDMTVGDPNIVPIHIAGALGGPDTHRLDIMIGDPNVAPPVVDRTTEGVHIVVSPPGPSCRALPPGPC